MTMLFSSFMIVFVLLQIGQYPDLKIEILPMTDYQQRGETFSVLGSKYDLFEGIYGPAGHV